MAELELMDAIVSLAKRRGFIFPSSEIYGGLGSCWDYGPWGVALKNNVKQAWWRRAVQERDDVVGQDASILMAPQVWQASGHVESFSDPLVDCKECKHRFRADDLQGDRCPDCGGELTAIRRFNLMFKTFMGPLEDDAAVVYLRPETAQGIFVNFKNAQTVSRKKLPFGIAQIGKAFRNEITPGKFTFRTREFEQMEIEYFVRPAEAGQWFDHWVKERFSWYTDFGIRPQNLRLRDHRPDELAHYAAACKDVEYNFPWGWSELEGLANRTDYDLKRHQESSGKDLTYFDEETHERFIPYVIEPSAGADRATLAFLVDAYAQDEAPTESGGVEKRVVLRLHRALAPFKAAILPLSRKDPLPAMAQKLHQELRRVLPVDYDDRGSIGKRYRRQDEVGTPFCITIDFDSMEDQAATIRDRDAMTQERVALDRLSQRLQELMAQG